MLADIGQWFKTTAIESNDEKLAQRRAAADALATAWEKAPGVQVVDAVSLGLEVSSARGAEKAAMASVLDAMATAQPSLDRDAAAANMEPRLCAIVAVGEMIARRAAKNVAWQRKEPAVVAAEAVASGMRFQTPVAGPYLEQRLAALLASAELLLDKGDQARRTRRADIPALIAAVNSSTELEPLRKATKAALETLWFDVQLDREELEALWWVFGGYSISSHRAFASLSPADAALLAGLELAQIATRPSSLGIAALASRVTSLSSGDSAGGIGKFLSTVEANIWSAISPSGKGAELVHKAPNVFPLCTIALAGGPNGGGNASSMREDLTKSQLAIQAFTEHSLLSALDG